jgi:predicted nucleic-acid-binding protein
VIAVDTNVLLRRLLNDDAMQAEKARRLFET